MPYRDHGVTQFLFATQRFVVLFGQNLIVVLSSETGKEVVSFAIRRGVLFGVDGDKLLVQYIADVNRTAHQYEAVSQSLEGDTVAQVSATLNYLTKISEESAVREQIIPTNFTKIIPDSDAMTISFYNHKTLKGNTVFLTPDGLMVSLD